MHFADLRKHNVWSILFQIKKHVFLRGWCICNIPLPFSSKYPSNTFNHQPVDCYCWKQDLGWGNNLLLFFRISLSVWWKSAHKHKRSTKVVCPTYWGITLQSHSIIFRLNFFERVITWTCAKFSTQLLQIVCVVQFIFQATICFLVEIILLIVLCYAVFNHQCKLPSITLSQCNSALSSVIFPCFPEYKVAF